MIELDQRSLLLAYMIVWLVIIVVLWIREIFRVHKFNWELSNSKLFHCNNCHHTFLTKDGANLTRQSPCPLSLPPYGPRPASYWPVACHRHRKVHAGAVGDCRLPYLEPCAGSNGNGIFPLRCGRSHRRSSRPCLAS